MVDSIVPNVGTNFHHVMYAATAAPKVNSTQQKFFNCILDFSYLFKSFLYGKYINFFVKLSS